MKECRQLDCGCSCADDSDIAVFEALDVDVSGAVRQQIFGKSRQLRGNMLEMAEAGCNDRRSRKSRPFLLSCTWTERRSCTERSCTI